MESRRAVGGGQLSRRLAHMLLARLGDLDISVRREASRLFAVSEPSGVLAHLARLLHDRDDRPRSAAESSILALLTGHEDPAGVVAAIIDIARLPASQALSQGASMRQPRHPGEIASPPRTSPKGAAAGWPDRLLRVLSKWASGAPRDPWRASITAVVNKLFGAPQDPVLVRACSQLAGAMSREVDAVLPLIEARLEELKRVDDEALARGDESCDQVRT